MTRPRVAVLGSLALAAGVGFFGWGHYFYRSAIGLDPSAFPLGGIMDTIGRSFLPDLGLSVSGIAFGLTLLLAVALVAFFWVRTSVRARVSETDPSRRSFLTGAAAGAGTAIGAAALGGAVGAGRAFLGIGNSGYGWQRVGGEIFAGASYTHPEYPDGWKGSRVESHRRLGRTEWKVSDIVLGTGRISGEQGEQIARLALERGVNYFDTAPDYSGSGSEQAMGRAIASLPRDEIFVATKFCTPKGHLPAGTPVAEYKRSIEASLGRLGLDHVDLVHIHSCDELDRLLDPNVHQAFDELKQEGKVRFLGFSSHTPRLVEVADKAIDSGRFDVMMLANHHGIWPELARFRARARR